MNVSAHAPDQCGPKPTGAGRKWFGTASLAAAMTLGAAMAGAQCVPDTLQATIPNSSLAKSSLFGYSVSIFGNLAVVGAPSSNPGGVAEAGMAYVLNATTGALVATLNNPTPAVHDWFGGSVAISGNLAVVGVPYDDPGGVLNAGTAYVFNATTGAQIARLDNPAPAADDCFGNSVAISGNLAVVGADCDDPGGVLYAGTAYVFNATTGGLGATLNNPDPTESDGFCNSVAISGNLAVVGATRDDPRGMRDAGTAYVFNATTGDLVATLNIPAPTAFDNFGSSVAISRNLVVVGAGQGQDAPGGVAYIFNTTTGALTATLNNPTPTWRADRFGLSVAISGNLAIVGATRDAPGGVLDAGTAYVFNATTGDLTATLNNPAPAVSDNFGNSVAISGNLAVVGADEDDPGGVRDAGSAYMFACIPPASASSN